MTKLLVLLALVIFTQHCKGLLFIHRRFNPSAKVPNTCLASKLYHNNIFKEICFAFLHIQSYSSILSPTSQGNPWKIWSRYPTGWVYSSKGFCWFSTACIPIKRTLSKVHFLHYRFSSLILFFIPPTENASQTTRLTLSKPQA